MFACNPDLFNFINIFHLSIRTREKLGEAVLKDVLHLNVCLIVRLVGFIFLYMCKFVCLSKDFYKCMWIFECVCVSLGLCLYGRGISGGFHLNFGCNRDEGRGHHCLKRRHPVE